MDSLHKTPVDIIKGVIQFNGRALILSIEHLVKVLPPSMLNLLVLQHELICSVFDAFDLVDGPCLPLLDFGHLIDVHFLFLRV